VTDDFDGICLRSDGGGRSIVLPSRVKHHQLRDHRLPNCDVSGIFIFVKTESHLQGEWYLFRGLPRIDR
jgi:hypothetical protein